jgi:hypothetical protein
VHGVAYEVSDKAKSEIYQAVLPILNSGNAELLELPRMFSQFLGLERRTARGGRDSIDHAPGGHDDFANAVAGALVLAYAGAARRGGLAIGVESFGSRGSGGGIVRGDKYLTADQIRAERPPPPADRLDFVWNEIEGRWAKPPIDVRSR